MMFLTEIILLAAVLIAIWFVKDRQKYSGYPPEPLRLPIVGNLFQIALQLTSYPAIAMKRLAEKYGDVMFLKMGMLEMVLFSSHSAATEILSSDSVLARHMVANLNDRNNHGNYGVIIASGNVWQTMRRFTIRTLRDFGFGKSASMDEAMNEEVQKFEEHFRSLMKNGNGVVHMECIFDLPVINVLWRLLTGQSYELDDTRIKRLLNLSEEYIRSTHLGDISIAYPVLRDWFPQWSGRNDQLHCIENLKTFIKQLIKENKDSGAYTNPECFLDVFLSKIEDGSTTESEFTYDQLVYVILDLFQAGSDTMSNILAFALLQMTRNPKIQQKVRDEINSVVPKNSPITIAMKTKLPYTSATIMEVLRTTSVLPMSIPREAVKDFYFRGYKIKQGTPIIVNYEAVNNEEAVWGDPHVFRPERFMNKDGTGIDPKMSEFLIAFGFGKRICLGQSHADATVLIYFANLMRHFNFSKMPQQPYPTSVPKLGITYAPVSFDVCVTEV